MMTINISVCWLVSVFSPVKSPTMGAVEVQGKPLMVRISLD